MRNTLVKAFTIAAVGSLMMGGVAYADMISGEISFSGGFETTGGTDLSDATGLDFAGGDDISGTLFVTGSTDDFSTIAWGDMGTIYDFEFASISSGAFTLWEVGDFTFTLATLSIDDQTTTDLDLSGTGYLSSLGYEDTYAEWNFSSNTVTGATFSWSSTTAASPVPEPSTMLLFGTGLTGLASIGRRKKN